jgi:GTP-binding protein HflX
MLESTESLLPDLQTTTIVCLGLKKHGLEEMRRLLTTLDAQVIGEFEVELRQVHSSTYFGSGKLEELKLYLKAQKAGCLILDVDVSPHQLKNVEKIVEVPVLDRSGVIIEIFSAHAKTREAKTQIELARLQYLMPRLAHYWNHFERQRGGGVGNKGMGEKQIEVDRRLVKKRVDILKARLVEIAKERQTQRASRKEVLKVALVGYTNAGKSTLLNALTQSRVLAEDKLFATLDASIRMLSPDSHPPLVAIDTVGFIDRLPTSLIASFRSTLEEVLEADLLVHVVDASSAQAATEMSVTDQVLKEIGAGDKPKMVVLNKKDLVAPLGMTALVALKTLSPGAIQISALDSIEVQQLRDKILSYFSNQLALIEIMIPYEESKLDAYLHQYGTILKTRHLEKGTFYQVRMDPIWIKKLKLNVYMTGPLMVKDS